MAISQQLNIKYMAASFSIDYKVMQPVDSVGIASTLRHSGIVPLIFFQNKNIIV